MIISDDFKSVTYDMEVTQDAVARVSEGKTAFKPQVVWTGEAIDLSLLSLGKKVYITFYDDYGNDLYAEKFENSSIITKRLNIAGLERGSYTLSIKAGDKNYTHIIKK